MSITRPFRSPARPPVRRPVALLAATATLVAPVLIAPAGGAAADPVTPVPLPDEGDVAAAVRSVDAADRADRADRAAGAGVVNQTHALARPSDAAFRAAALAVPVAGVRLPARLDARASFTGQNSCDPVDKSGAVAFGRLMRATYRTGIVGISRWCNGSASEHMEGRAVDWMLDARRPAQKAVGDAATAWLVANRGENARRLGVMYIIWNRRMWRAYAPERGWQPYTGASPHTDHVHVSLTWDGATKRTSWWTGRAVTASDLGPCRAYVGSPAPIYAGRRTGSCRAPVAAPGSRYPVYVPGQRSPNIAIAQRRLGIGADGAFGHGTRRAVLAYQRKARLPRTGVLDKATWVRLVPSSAITRPRPAPTPAPPRVTPPPVTKLPARVTTRYTSLKNTRIGPGARGTAVRVLQKGLNVPSTGYFGPQTRTALVAFQRSRRLPATGRTDLKVWNRLEVRQFPWLAYLKTTVRRGSTGPSVVALQKALRLRADGQFGPGTATAVMTVQARYGLKPDAIVGPLTWRAVAAAGPK